MQIKDLQPKQGKIDIDVEVKDIGDVREFQKFGKIGRVANAIVSDDTGTIKLTLWNEDIDKIRAGDKLKITNGFVSEFQGEKQLSAGRFGKLEVKGSKE
ncbi:MAG: DNA-binding protein [Nanoarchaeota archaeon]|nr:DNA-binding protein [Nanoarchaeota archaeon]